MRRVDVISREVFDFLVRIYTSIPDVVIYLDHMDRGGVWVDIVNADESWLVVARVNSPENIIFYGQQVESSDGMGLDHESVDILNDLDATYHRVMKSYRVNTQDEI